jgi:crotonobetainyl-CoA:carnitine CoA-transferase CaiB-like acyl-CoA transferase
MIEMDGNNHRTIAFQAASRICVLVSNRSTHFAAHWLALLTGEPFASPDTADIWIVGNDTELPDSANRGATAIVRLWDYQVGFAGSGTHASAVSGAATVVGPRDGPPIPLPAEMPEKWCGAHGSMLAMAECWRPQRDDPDEPVVQYDVSSADILRSFCLQNSGGRKEMAHSWRRNGRLCIEHGGIFPMGFFACHDGHVAILGRSRRDWKNIRAAIGDPDWAKVPEFENPFALARDGARADMLLEETLAPFRRDDLLKRGIANQAVIAPVYTQDEAHARGIFRAGFIQNSTPAMPFVSNPIGAAATHSEPARPSEKAVRPGQPLAGLRVIELCWIWSGPMVGQMLADLGAEVIKIESPNRFDLYRTRGLEAMRGKMDEAKRIESSLYFHSLNRNKFGLSLDLKTDRGRQALLDLAAHSNILLENFTVGTLDRLGLGADVLAAANPKLVQLSMSGPGRGSSVEQLRSYGLVLSALAGAEAHIKSTGEFFGSPTFSISDPNAAIFAMLGALAGSLRARAMGTGLAIDLSQIEAAATLAGTPADTSNQATVQGSGDGDYAVAGSNGQVVPVLQLEATDAAPEFAACSGWLASSHPVTGDEHLVAAPWRVNGERPPVHATAPLLGSGNAYVLGEVLKMSGEAIRACEAN